jgi:hypothetical protein
MINEQEKALIAQIEQAFANTPHPGNDHLTDCPCVECTNLRADFKGKTWQSLTDVKFLRYNSAALSLLQPVAMHYFLPAYMIASIIDRETADIIPNAIGYMFTQPVLEDSEADAMEYWLRRVSGFTAEQKRTIGAFLKHEYERYPFEWEIMPGLKEKQQKVLDDWAAFPH